MIYKATYIMQRDTKLIIAPQAHTNEKSVMRIPSRKIIS